MTRCDIREMYICIHIFFMSRCSKRFYKNEQQNIYCISNNKNKYKKSKFEKKPQLRTDFEELNMNKLEYN